jgi:hypothetical protein
VSDFACAGILLNESDVPETCAELSFLPALAHFASSKAAMTLRQNLNDHTLPAESEDEQR